MIPLAAFVPFNASVSNHSSSKSAEDCVASGLVRLRVKKASQELERTFEQLLKKAEADRGSMANRFDSPFAEITDEDIDSLFSE